MLMFDIYWEYFVLSKVWAVFKVILLYIKEYSYGEKMEQKWKCEKQISLTLVRKVSEAIRLV